MEEKKPRVIVYVDGGCVQEVRSSIPLVVSICDWDNARVDADEADLCHQLEVEGRSLAEVLPEQVPPRHGFLNHYHCHVCNVSWANTWDCACNDHCPKCNREIEPRQSDDLKAEGGA